MLVRVRQFTFDDEILLLVSSVSWRVLPSKEGYSFDGMYVFDWVKCSLFVHFENKAGIDDANQY